MNPLIINSQTLHEIKSVVGYAEENKITEKIFKEMIRNNTPVSKDINRVCYLEIGYRVVFSIDWTPDGWYRHISISLESEKKVPLFPIVEVIINKFGFKGGIFKQVYMWME